MLNRPGKKPGCHNQKDLDSRVRGPAATRKGNPGEFAVHQLFSPQEKEQDSPKSNFATERACEKVSRSRSSQEAGARQPLPREKGGFRHEHAGVSGQGAGPARILLDCGDGHPRRHRQKAHYRGVYLQKNRGGPGKIRGGTKTVRSFPGNGYPRWNTACSNQGSVARSETESRTSRVQSGKAKGSGLPSRTAEGGRHESGRLPRVRFTRGGWGG